MKRMFAMLFCLLLTVPLLALHISAEGEPPATAEQETGTEPTETVEPSQPTEPELAEPETAAEEKPDLLDRLQEAWDSGDITAALTLLYNIVCTVFLFVLKASSNANTISIRKKVDELTDTAVEKVNEVVKGYNGIALENQATSKEITSVKDSMLEFEKKFAQLAEHENTSVQKMQAQIGITNRSAVALASMLQTIYSNSTTIPQSVKDIINQKYIEVVKAAQPEDKQSEK